MPKSKNPVGRPTVFTKDVIDKLEMVFCLGGTDDEACLYANISVQALYKYQERQPDFLERKRLLKETQALQARQTVATAIKKDPKLAFDYLKAKKRDEFATKTEVEQTGETAVTITYVYPTDKNPADTEATPDVAEA